MLFRRSVHRLSIVGLCVALLTTVNPLSAAVAPVSLDKPKPITVAHIKLTGSLAEKPPVIDPLLGQLGETFRTKLDRLEKARNDKDVQAIVLEINDLSLGWGKLNELTEAIARIRASGKKVFAHLESGSQQEYLLALACDEICVTPAGWLMLTGVRAEATFYKGLLAKLGIQADMLQMGDFKGAAEPYTRDSLSKENRQQLTAILDDFYENDIVARIVKARASKKLTTDKVKQIIDEGPYSANAALALGLIDRVAYLDPYAQESLKESLKAAAVKVTRDYGKKKDEDLNIFSLYSKLLFGPTRASTSRAAKVAVIFADGAIMTGKSSSGLLNGDTVGSDTIIEAIREAEKDSTVKAIVLRVDSPGGSALASDLIWNELKRCKKPVIASMSNVAGSGGYYICMCAKKIYAEPGTITGSIGVVGGKMAIRGLYDKVGIKTETITRGKNSGLLGGTDPFTEDERKVFRKLMEDIYDQFLTKALQGRQAAGKQMSMEQLKKLAGGRIYTGRQAKAVGLIDELGTLEDAIREAAKLGGLPSDKQPELLQLPKQKNSLESLLGSAFDLKTALGVDVVKLKEAGLLEPLRGVDALMGLQREPVWAILPFRLDVK